MKIEDNQKKSDLLTLFFGHVSGNDKFVFLGLTTFAAELTAVGTTMSHRVVSHMVVSHTGRLSISRSW